MVDKRSLKRRHPVYYLQVTDLGTGNNLGYLIDINAIGLMIAGPSAVLPEKKFNISIQLPEEMEGEQTILLKVSSVWSEFDPLLENTRIGFKIEESTQKELEKINWLIDNFGFRD